jgi:pantoate--beta-alanine ligase
MITVTTLGELRQARVSLVEPVGFVPTMGYLHKGHLSLVRQARKECASVITSIFVNPTQFGPQEDLQAYPRDLPRDLHLLVNEGVDLVWTPSVDVMYPAGFQTWVTVEDVTSRLEGSQRPGHFRGVATVVAKLFNATAPHRAYFGQKDAQQAAVIRRMVQDLDMPVQIVVCPTVREADGLAMSSRNVYLSAAERQAAPVLYRALQAAQAAYKRGERSAEQLRQIMQSVLAETNLAQPQYVSCADPETLQELDWVNERALLSMAVYFGNTRLIDNLLLPEQG